MLLPSALSCDASHRNAPAPPTLYQSAAALFSSPPTSPPPNVSSTLFATCRALQSMLSSPSPTQLPTPPMTHAPPPPTPSKLRLRPRKTTLDGQDDPSTPRMSRRKISKRNVPPPRGINKRRRAIDDDARRNIIDSDDEDENARPPPDQTAGPSTPKRIRLAPEVIPMGLERSDFDRLARNAFPPIGTSLEAAPETTNTDAEAKNDNAPDNTPEEEQWSSAEDRLLVELVLEKLKLSKSDWQDCARSLGKDRGSVGRRWKSLMGHGEVGLKRGAGAGAGAGGGGHLRRGKIHATWRA